MFTSRPSLVEAKQAAAEMILHHGVMTVSIEKSDSQIGWFVIIAKG